MTENEYISAVKRNSQRIFLLAFSYMQNQYDAEDIMQETFMKLWNSKTVFEGDEHMDKWLMRVCINACKDNFRLVFRKHVPLEEAVNVSCYDRHFNVDLFNAVSSLQKKERVIVHMFYYEDMSVKEISELLHIKESTIKSLLHRSRKKLKAQLGDEWINE